MSLFHKNTLLGASGAGGAAEALYVDDVFSCFLYDGNGSTSHSINNGIDLSGEEGLVWFGRRDDSAYKPLFDTERGATKALYSNANLSEDTASTDLTAFNSNGFTVAQGATVNASGGDYVSWTFRKAPGFFDVVTYTGNATAGRTIAHNLGSVPGCIMVKCTSSAYGWMVFHRSTGKDKYLMLHSTIAATTDTARWNNTDPTSTEFTVGNAVSVNGSGETYVAYIFAHDDQSFGDDSDEAINKCGSFSGSIGNGGFVDLGFEPQWVMTKRTDSTSDWTMCDIMRGATDNFASTGRLKANNTNAEDNFRCIFPQPTGFLQYVEGASAATMIYIAIRRPHKPPTTGTDVFKATKASGTTDMTTNFPVDLLINKSNYSGTNNYVVDRLRGSRSTMLSDGTNTEYTGWTQDAFPLDNNIGVDAPYWGSGTDTWSTHLFRRAPGFLDIVAYTGNSSARDINHNLGVTPQLIILKSRTLGESWPVLSTLFSDVTANRLTLNLNGALLSGASGYFKTPTATTFGIGSAAPSEGQWNRSGEDYIAYLFATLDGISKVGTYSGTGSNLDVDCGFTAGARYVLIKRTDSTGNWYVFDHAQGIVSGNDGYWNYDTNGAGVTSNDYIDPLNSGFTVSSSAPAALNASGGTYLFLAIA